MCGISGITSKEYRVNVDELNRMNFELRHRGPDDCGTFIDISGNAALGHRRLSILDLTERGHQPMSTHDGRLTIVFNGEIYNYIELRNELEKMGLIFSTSTDTEVLLRAYETWGIDVLDRFVGMFAFAIWDRDERSMFLARDRVGKKPILYFWDGKIFAFASELKAFMSAAICEPRLNPNAVDLYLALGYIPAPFTVFQHIYKLQPGHYLKYVNNNIKIARFWFPEKSGIKVASTAQERVEEYHELFKEAVRIRLRSDVPIALFLSGGLDSSAVGAECVKQGQRPHAFTVVFDHDQIDLPYATKVAVHLGIEHEVIKTSGNETLHDLDKILWHYDEPFADSSSIPSFYIARAVNGRYKVILNGDGGDEAFGGYRHYEHIGLKQFGKNLASMVGLMDGNAWQAWQVYFQSKSIFRKYERRKLLFNFQEEDNFQYFLDNNPFLKEYTSNESLRLALWGDRHIYLANDLLYKMDISLMSQGIEGRSPFLDHRLLEWAQYLPLSDLVNGKFKKILLKNAFCDQLPCDVLNRKKHGFGAPFINWLKGSMNDILLETLPSPYFDFEMQKTLLDYMNKCSLASSSGRIWALLIFSLWAKKWGARW